MSKPPISLMVLLAVLLTACGARSEQSQTTTGVPDSTAAAPARVEVGGASRCDPNNLLSQLKDDIPYSQVSLLHNQLLAVPYLNLWVVYPDLNSAPAVDEVEANQTQATELAARLGHLLANDHPCVRVSFEQITMTIVDSRYHAWFVGGIGMEDIPSGADLTEDEMTTLKGHLVSSTALQSPVEHPGPDVPPADSCDWDKALEGLRTQFAPAGPNVDFYLVIDQDGANVWAQWEDSNPQQTSESFLPGVLALQTELQCLNPPVDVLWMVYTDGAGRVSLVMAADGEALRNPDPGYLVNHLQVIYPAPSS